MVMLQMARALPRATKWIRQVLVDHTGDAVPVMRFGHRHLQQYYPERLLDHTRVVVADQLPNPPLNEWGFDGLDLLPSEQTSGITFLDTFFVRRSCVDDEALFFHELVHVVQWKRLGLSRFLLLYGVGLAYHGYLSSPLEAMAYRIGSKFQPGSLPFDAYQAALQDTGSLVEVFKQGGISNRLAWGAAALGPRR